MPGSLTSSVSSPATRLNQSLYIWSKTMLPNYVLSNLGIAWRWRLVEGRLPFLDHHVVEEAVHYHRDESRA